MVQSTCENGIAPRRAHVAPRRLGRTLEGEDHPAGWEAPNAPQGGGSPENMKKGKLVCGSGGRKPVELRQRCRWAGTARVQRKACRGRRRKKERRGRRAARGVQRPSQKEGAAREAWSARRAEAVAERRSGAGGVQRKACRGRRRKKGCFARLGQCWGTKWGLERPLAPSKGFSSPLERPGGTERGLEQPLRAPKWPKHGRCGWDSVGAPSGGSSGPLHQARA